MKKRTLKTKKITKIKEPTRDRELPVTKRFLDLKIQEVKGDVTSLRLEMKAGFTKIDARFSQIDSRFAQMDARFHEQDTKFEMLDTKMTKMLILMEDQNDRNLAAHDKNATIYQRLVDNDARVEKLEEHVFGIKQR